ncbi:hypothetical protein L1987_04386 [Smallanthus sonchifolius]|uniref:Uncharacterized protein n=1 Tax=Smallanthus sonchifolius TaxID=185202 RepID=A0ACB9KDA8_9ASTR|nr:hypothetical protein L1987_04386 [Smallanthus sonchifolius]
MNYLQLFLVFEWVYVTGAWIRVLFRSIFYGEPPIRIAIQPLPLQNPGRVSITKGLHRLDDRAHMFSPPLNGKERGTSLSTERRITKDRAKT